MSARGWFALGLLLVAIKLAITAYYIAIVHAAVPSLPLVARQLIWWATKVTPTMFCICFLMWAKDRGVGTLRIFQWFLALCVIYTIIVVYAMFHRWNGIQL